MAGLPPCMNHPETPAICIVTMLESGDVVTVCGDCLRDFCMTLLEAFTGLPVNEILTSIVSDGPITEPTEGAPDPTLHDSESPESSGGDTTLGRDPTAEELAVYEANDAARAAAINDESPVTTES